MMMTMVMMMMMMMSVCRLKHFCQHLGAFWLISVASATPRHWPGLPDYFLRALA